MKRPYEHAIDKWKTSIIEVHSISLNDGREECRKRGDGIYRVVHDNGWVLVEVVDGILEDIQ